MAINQRVSEFKTAFNNLRTDPDLTIREKIQVLGRVRSVAADFKRLARQHLQSSSLSEVNTKSTEIIKAFGRHNEELR